MAFDFNNKSKGSFGEQSFNSGSGSGFQSPPEPTQWPTNGNSAPAPWSHNKHGFSQPQPFSGGQSFPGSRPRGYGGGRPRQPVEIPWKLIMIIALIVGAIALLILYRDYITAFIAQILVWVFALLLAFLIIKGIIRSIFRW